MEDIFQQAQLLVKKAWKFIVVSSVLFGFYAYFHEKKPDIQFTIVGDPNVFDVYKSVNDLEIYFRGKDIEKDNLNLKVYTIRIENIGESDVLKSFYDDSLPWGFSIDNGEIVSEPRVVKSNSQYLESSLNPQIKNGVVEFDKVILDRDKYVVVEFLVSHKRSEIPHMKTFGKIAGVDQFGIINEADQETRPLVKQVFDGDIIVHVVRAIFYAIISTVPLLCFIFVVDKFDQMKIARAEARRSKFFNNYLDKEPIPDPNLSLFIRDLYVKSGWRGLKKFRKKLRDEQALLFELDALDRYEKNLRIIDRSVRGLFDIGTSFSWFNMNLLKALVITKDASKVIDPNLKLELNKAISYLSNFKQ